MNVVGVGGSVSSVGVPSVGTEAVGSWEWNIRADRLYADDHVAQLLGSNIYATEAGTPLSGFAACIHPDDRAAVIERMMNGAAKGVAFVAEFRIVTASGEMRWVLARGRYDLGESGEPLRGRGILLDMTGSRLSDQPYGCRIGSPPEDPLERAADHCLAARKAIQEADRPFLLKLVDMLLLELGRTLATQSKRKHQRTMC
ncbi:hypothetical protein VQ02_05100 [Methylobacterium variabile]|jgi:hypothetical protein|uniref:histidine kinase n=1 Tax=Methylobacterium variabile TaxID=298794 RepID=A0A0J6VQS6_9HYPH|nr:MULTISPECIES: PAS domain-containing protein [Methylobacterium]KMO41561.1 hypothetical protein VQ02_05100 [Methylobacterium variabile]NGM37315.1 PAS domain-containing protein [Methylobacterium sp. DB0501]UHC20330.1 PAS domain-containing protein [Methylobacterium currus]